MTDNAGFGKALALLLLGVVVQRSLRAVDAVHRHRFSARPAAAPRRLQRWESEGGKSVTPQTAVGPTADASA